MAKNDHENSTIIEFLEFFGLIQIILVVIKLFGGLKDWPITALLLPSIIVITLVLSISVAFVLMVIGLIMMNKQNKE